MPRKLPASFTRRHFIEKATALTIRVPGVGAVDAIPKVLSTGSLGWQANSQVWVEVGGVTVPAQLTVGLTILDSKSLPQDGPNGPVAPQRGSA